MRAIDFTYGDKLIEKESCYEKEIYEKYMHKEESVKSICDKLIRGQNKENWEKLVFYVTQNEIGTWVVNNTNWGRTLLLACKVYMLEQTEEFCSKFSNLDQLIYVMRQFRFMNYRYQSHGDIKAKENLNQLFMYFMLTDQQQKEILMASKLSWREI